MFPFSCCISAMRRVIMTSSLWIKFLVALSFINMAMLIAIYSYSETYVAIDKGKYQLRRADTGFHPSICQSLLMKHVYSTNDKCHIEME